MNINAIVYTSNTGYTAEYAKIIGRRTGLAVYSLDDAKKKLPRNSSVIYLGWLMAGGIKGCKKARIRYKISAVCAVGMCKTGSEMQNVRKSNAIPENIPVFTLQGGFDLKRLTGIYKLIMTVMKKTVGKGLADRKNRTSDEEALLEVLTHGGSRVCEENLKDFYVWNEKNCI